MDLAEKAVTAHKVLGAYRVGRGNRLLGLTAQSALLWDKLRLQLSKGLKHHKVLACQCSQS